jgi:ribosomal protein S27AE
MDFYDIFQDIRLSTLEVRLESSEYLNRLNTQSLFLEVSQKMDRLVLLNQAMAEILVEKLGVTNKEILNKMNEIDMRDGVKDGKYIKPAKDCPKCTAKINNHFNRCLFCGYIDNDPGQVLY